MQIHELTSKTSTFSSSDQFVTDNGTTTTKSDFNTLANAILATYSGTTLAGAAQTAKTALDNLKTKADAFDAIFSAGSTAGLHNSIYRGKNITSYLTDGTLWKRIGGTDGYSVYEDLWLGDYITVGSNSYAIVDFDYYRNCGDTNINVNHLVMMPTGNMSIPEGTTLYGGTNTLQFINTTNAGVDVSSQETATAFKWNATMAAPNTHTTAGGYKFSRMRQTIMKAADTIVVNAFGSAHVKPITVLYYNPAAATDSGLADGRAWFSDSAWTSDTRMSICDLPNETQIYGQQVWGLGSAFGNVAYEIGIDKFQFSAFKHQRALVDTRTNWWLRSVFSNASAAHLGGGGHTNYGGSAHALGVRPRFLLVA